MINEEKVRIMTRCATFEKHCGRTELPMAGYFKSDYVKLQIAKTLLAVLLAYFIVAAIIAAGYYEALFAQLNQLHFEKLAWVAGGVLVVLLFAYFILARVLYARRFERARKKVAAYYRDLKHLKAIYNREQDDRPKMFEEGGTPNDEFIDY